jgi:hypothetical protein
MRRILLALALLAAGSSAYGEGLTGEDFLNLCVSTDPTSRPKNRDENDQIIRCLGYFEGTVTSMIILNGTGFCLPHNVHPADVLMSTVNWLHTHPDQTKYLAASDVIAAAQEKWPCH